MMMGETSEKSGFVKNQAKCAKEAVISTFSVSRAPILAAFVISAVP